MSLSNFLDQFQPNGLPLGLVHCTPVLRGIQALNAGELKKESCPVYGESLVYLFYGRPAFKPLPAMGASRMDEHLPMCLVFDAAIMGTAARVLPFDSGGFDRYTPSTGTLKRESFELTGSADVPPKLVAAFYETNLNYYRQMPRVRPEEISNLYPEARAIARLANDDTVLEDDDRRTTIEVQFARGLPLRDALVAIIGPPAMEVEVPVLQILQDCPNAVLRTYRTYGRQKALAHAGQLYDIVEDFFRWQTLL